MRRLTKTERAAAAAVLAMAASVAGAGAALLKKHTRLMAQKAASLFDMDKEGGDGEGKEEEAQKVKDAQEAKKAEKMDPDQEQ